MFSVCDSGPSELLTSFLWLNFRFRTCWCVFEHSFAKVLETSQNQVDSFIPMEGICFSFGGIAGKFHSSDLEDVWTSVSCSSSPFVPSLPSALWRPDCCFPLPGCFIYICSPSTSHLLCVSHRCAADTSSGRPGSTICCFMSLSPLFSSSLCGYRTTRGPFRHMSPT